MAIQEPLPTDSRSYERDGDVLPVDELVDPEALIQDTSEYALRQVNDGEIISQTTRTIQKALAEQAIEEEVSLSETNMSRHEALKTLHEQHGFYPRDVDEKDSMLGILGRSKESHNPTVKYLGDVKRKHEKLKSKNPNAAIYSLVRHFQEYAKESHTEAAFTHHFTKIAEARATNLEQPLIDESNFRPEELTEPSVFRTLAEIVRLIETEQFAKTGEGKYPLALRNGVDSLQGKERLNYIVAALSTIPMSEVMEHKDRVAAEDTKRFDYWYGQLEQAAMYNDGTVRAEALKALKALSALRSVEA